jgi:hypothetical protein
VVLAQGKDVDVLDGHHLVVLLVEDGAPQHLARVLLVPLRQERDRILEPLRGFLEPFAVGVLPDLDEQVADDILHNGTILMQEEDPPK